MRAGEVFAWIVVAKVIYNLCRVVTVKLWRAYQSSTPSMTTASKVNGDECKLLVIFPLLNEAEMIDNLLATSERLIKEAPGQVQVLFACSGRESHLGDSATAHLLRSRLEGTSSTLYETYIYVTDGSDHCKADQLNFALEQHLRASIDYPTNKVWVGIYDADSSPQEGTVLELLQLSQNSKECVYQQAPLYTKSWQRFEAPSRLLSSAFGLSRALYSHIFSYKESFGYLCSGGVLDIRLHHFTGHGYFVRLDTLERFGGFDPPSCDTTLGYKLTFGGVPFALMQTRDLSEVPHDLSMIYRQGIVWFNGCEMYLREYERACALSSNSASTLRNHIRITQVFLTNLSWSCLPICWCIALLLTYEAASYEWHLALCSWLSLRLMMWFDMLSLDVENSRRVPLLTLIFSPLVTPISVLWGCLSPLTYYLRKITRSHLELMKTQRAKQR